jgi:protocatechuate 3,4-dioxygenase beta subunit
MNRKNFITTSLLTAVSLSTFGKVTQGEDGNFTGDCDTTNDILGPFYRADAPFRSDLMHEGLVGTKITIKGRVFKSDCTTPIHNALVEIWHCDTEGKYDNKSSAFHLRARWKTNEKGEYSFTTILPGKYLNGERFRPAHIHYRVGALRHNELISQIYFQGDPYIEKDPWAAQKKAVHRILPILPDDIKGGLTVVFDVYLT